MNSGGYLPSCFGEVNIHCYSPTLLFWFMQHKLIPIPQKYFIFWRNGFRAPFFLRKPPGGEYHLLSRDWGTNQITWKALFTCVVYTNIRYALSCTQLAFRHVMEMQLGLKWQTKTKKESWLFTEHCLAFQNAGSRTQTRALQVSSPVL